MTHPIVSHSWVTSCVNNKWEVLFRKFFFLRLPISNRPILTENQRSWLAIKNWFWRFFVSHPSVSFGTGKIMDRFIKNKYIEKLFWYSWYIVIGLSVSAEYLIGPFPPNFFSNDQNWLNQKMVKWGWGWTLYSVITFSVFINLADQNIMVRWLSVVLELENSFQKNIFRTVIRVFGFGTLIWYFGTQDRICQTEPITLWMGVSR